MLSKTPVQAAESKLHPHQTILQKTMERPEQLEAILWGTKPIPIQFIQVLPYIVTMLVLAGFVGRSRPPSALGKAWE